MLDGFDPISIVGFLFALQTDCTTYGILEGAAKWLILSFMKKAVAAAVVQCTMRASTGGPRVLFSKRHLYNRLVHKEMDKS